MILIIRLLRTLLTLPPKKIAGVRIPTQLVLDPKELTELLDDLQAWTLRNLVVRVEGERQAYLTARNVYRVDVILVGKCDVVRPENDIHYALERTRIVSFIPICDAALVEGVEEIVGQNRYFVPLRDSQNFRLPVEIIIVDDPCTMEERRTKGVLLGRSDGSGQVLERSKVAYEQEFLVRIKNQRTGSARRNIFHTSSLYHREARGCNSLRSLVSGSSACECRSIAFLCPARLIVNIWKG